MTTDSTIADTATPAQTGVERGLELSIWDALLVGRVSATRPGLRVRASDVAPGPTTPTARRQEVAR